MFSGSFVSFLLLLAHVDIVVASRSTSALSYPDLKMTGGSSAATSANVSVNAETQAETENTIANTDPHTKDIRILFSDVDGTLVHYHPATAKHDKAAPEQQPRKNKMLKLPPSATGMRGIISSNTLAQTQQLRRSGVKLVLISGMRTSTLLKRLPFLPKADAYCSEAGGRIFYPVTTTTTTTTGEKEDSCDIRATRDAFLVTPQAYSGAQKEEGDLTPFQIVEDLEWRQRMEQTAGSFGKTSLQEVAFHPDKVLAMHERDGLLWDFARDLTSKGYVLDTEGYSACFRVNLKQQKIVSPMEFQALLLGGNCPPWPGIATSVNLANVDYYPQESGKKNWYVSVSSSWCADCLFASCVSGPRSMSYNPCSHLSI
jgi:hypothetical protein